MFFVGFELKDMRVMLRQWEYAATDFTTALSYKRDFPAALSYRGATRLELGHLQNAIDDCTAAIRLSPGQSMNVTWLF